MGDQLLSQRQRAFCCTIPGKQVEAEDCWPDDAFWTHTHPLTNRRVDGLGLPAKLVGQIHNHRYPMAPGHKDMRCW
jgi:hypothetical protein